MKRVLYLFGMIFFISCNNQEVVQYYKILGPDKFSCPQNDNCQTSLGSGKSMDAINFAQIGNRQVVLEKIQKALSEMEDHQLVTKSDVAGSNIQHYEFKTPLLRFTDDFLIMVSWDQKLIHLKSASRVGKYDLGKNKSRIERFKFLFHQN